MLQGDGETTAAGVGKAEESGVADPAAKRAGNCSQDEGQESELEHWSLPVGKCF